MIRSKLVCLPISLAALCISCSKPAPVEQAEPPKAAESSAFKLYTTNEVSGDMTIIDSADYHVIATVPLGKRPRGIHPSPRSQDHLRGAQRIAHRRARSRRGFAPARRSHGRWNRRWKQIYISNEDDAEVSTVDVASGTVVKSAKVGAQPEGVKVTPDGKLVWVTSEETGTISVFDPETGKILKTFKVGHRPRSIAFTLDAKNAYVNAENDGTVVYVDAVKGAMLKPIPLGKAGEVKPMAVLMSPDGSKLYVSTGRGHKVFTIDTATNSVASRRPESSS